MEQIEKLLQFSIINIDKPSGPTSFGVDTIIKKQLNLTKTSHFGTLDPMVTGVLPIALNRACRLMNYFIGKPKTYIGVMRLHEEITETKLKKQMKKFIGEITQLPPVKSRVKRQQRQRTIYSFKILEKKGKDVLFESKVQAGTYIRKLIHDLGEKIGGAHMTELRRTHASIFNEKDSYTIYEFLEAVEEYKKGNQEKLKSMLIPGEIIKQVLPEVQVKKQFIKKLFHGSPLMQEYISGAGAVDREDKIAVFNNKTFIGVFNIINQGKILAKPEFILQPLK